MPNAEFAHWRKSSYSDGENSTQGNCVEVAFAGAVGVRDSKDPSSGVLTVTRAAWAAFLAVQQ